MLGTPGYLAPEVAARSAKQATTASDVYALGAILYELLAGRPPFQAEGLTALLRQIVEDEPIAPSALSDLGFRISDFSPPIPRDLEVICLRCLAKEPARRYDTAGALAEDLHRWLAGEAIHARSVSIVEKLWLWVYGMVL